MSNSCFCTGTLAVRFLIARQQKDGALMLSNVWLLISQRNSPELRVSRFGIANICGRLLKLGPIVNLCNRLVHKHRGAINRGNEVMELAGCISVVDEHCLNDITWKS